jgi:hypothetical protein
LGGEKVVAIEGVLEELLGGVDSDEGMRVGGLGEDTFVTVGDFLHLLMN